ncbi:acetolactate synthase small subunit [Alkalitalea saponilacus]|uniref:Acetolactate synthase small subunit n=1 Tax=Alkalitalea saponilacus TaxID=889453 RepID=A0A1T5HT73_9BACT|nr:acetolactate synthase small subunit [Alkalitalea saponilacus]ASB48969.1 acetolactate synthase small subunit [Alkalitalea saponilacus]SKC23884.1 acetolactate synthase, small subunit [Alkalitalea saponilacus]
MSLKQEFTLSIFSENVVGLLNQITNVFTRRHLNIESLTTSESAIAGIHKFTIVVFSTRNEIEKVAKQIEKRIDVIKAFVLTADDIIHEEVALYKVPTASLLNGNQIETLVRQYGARILEVTPEFFVIEKTGHKKETQELFEKLDQYGVSQFTRSGRISITKTKTEMLDNYLRKLELDNPVKN